MPAFSDGFLGVPARPGKPREIGLTLDQFEGDRYIRLKHLRLLLDRGDLDPELRWRAARVR